MKLLVIGLDGMSPALLEKLIEDEIFVNIGKLMKHYGKLESTFPPVTGPAWTSFATGVNPSTHGIIDFAMPKNELNNIVALNSQDIKVKTFYEILEENNKKFVLINLPFSWPPLTKQPTITSLMTNGDFIFPPELAEKAPSLKNYRIVPKTFGEGRVADIRELEKTRFQSAIELTKDEDFFFILFSGTDWVNHSHYDKLLSGTAPQEIIDLLREIDSYVGKLCEKAEKYIIISDHGFKTVNKIYFINSWLEQKGYLKRSSLKLKRGMHLFEKERRKEQKIKEENNIDLKKTKAYMATYESQRISLNKNVDNPTLLQEEIIAELQKDGFEAWKDGSSILVASDGHIQTRTSKEVKKETQKNVHDKEGIIISNIEITDSKIIDIAPTILAFFGIGIPANMEGQSLIGGEKVKSSEVSREKEDGEKDALNRLRSLGYID